MEIPNLHDFLLSPGSSRSPVSEPWSPSLQSSQRPEVTPIQTPLHEPNENSGDWRCRNCEAETYEQTGESTWQCLACGSRSFYDTRHSVKEVTDRGTWMYMPHGDGRASSSSSRRRRRRRQQPGGPPTDPGDGETAESEHPTVDPIVEPDPPARDVPGPPVRDPVARGGRGRGKGGGHREEPPGSLTSTDGKLLQTLQRLVDKDTGGWSSAKGPSKGVRWKSGQPPAPPVWRYDKEDLRAYSSSARRSRSGSCRQQHTFHRKRWLSNSMEASKENVNKSWNI